MGIQGEFFERPTDNHLSASELSLTETVAAPVTDDRFFVDRTPEDLDRVIHSTPRNNAHVAEEAVHTRRTMKDLSIPKLYYSISEVSRLTGLEPYVLRYWESEFEELKPQKNRAGNRIYSNRDIKFILRIKELLRERRYTIEGAKHILKQDRVSEVKTQEEAVSEADPAQIPLAPVTQPAPQATLTLEEIQSMKDALLALRSVFKG